MPAFFMHNVLLWRQLLRQMLVRKLLFLVCSFFSVTWNISQIFFFKTKCKLECQHEFLWETIIEIWKHKSQIFSYWNNFGYVFHIQYRRIRHWNINWTSERGRENKNQQFLDIGCKKYFFLRSSQKISHFSLNWPTPKTAATHQGNLKIICSSNVVKL